MTDNNDIFMQNGKGEDRKSAEEMDVLRQKMLAYEYLCHLEEAKKWMEACLRESLPPTTELEENLRNGIYLAKLGHFIAPDILPLNKIYDSEQRRYKIVGLQFRHTDNINHFLRCLKCMQLPLIFQPETTDIYDKKNMPRVIYCIHALSTHLFKLGRAPQIQDLYGKINFTDEEIDTVSKELRKYGIQMPAFQKIGGLLTNNIATDTATLHAAVIAVNQAVVKKDNIMILQTLQCKAAQLNNIVPAYIEKYTKTLSEAKAKKVEAALNRSLNDSYEPDAYDELLTQVEIQGHINYVNAYCALKTIISSAYCEDNKLIPALMAQTLSLKNIIPENAEMYNGELWQLFENVEWHDIASKNIHYWQKLLQNSIDRVNEIALQHHERKETVERLNMVLLQDSDEEKFYEILRSPCLGISHQIDEFAVPLYHQEMKEDRLESEDNITYNDIVVSVTVLTTIASISKAVDTGNPDLVYEKLSSAEARIFELDEENKAKYTCALTNVRHEKQLNGLKCTLLTYSDIQICVDSVNAQCIKNSEVIEVLQRLNRAVIENDYDSLTEAFETICMKLDIHMSSYDMSLYLKLFKERLIEKQFDGSELWLDDVETIAEMVKSESMKVEDMITFLSDINEAVKRDNMLDVIDCLQIVGCTLNEACHEECYQALRQLQKRKREIYSSPYVLYITDNGNEAYIDVEKNVYTWDRPTDIMESYYITREDVKEIIKSIDVASKKRQKWHENRILEEIITRFQACIRGYLLRKKIHEIRSQFKKNLKKVVMIQAWWRGVMQRKRYLKFLERKWQDATLHEHKSLNAKTMNSYDILSLYKNKQDIRRIIKIQALWRGRISRKAFHSLLYSEKPSFAVVRHFSTVLGFNAEDYDKDLELQKLKLDVVQGIKHNQNLSQQLDSMYVKIGLLIQNRIALQDVVAHSKNLDTLAKEKNTTEDQVITNDNIMTKAHKGLRSLTKESRKILEGYQHLFYALQTNPQYLSKLLHLPPQGKTNKLFLKNVILTLFNFGSNTREDYLLLKLFGSALREEIRCNCDKPSDVLTGKPLVREMVVSYAKQLSGQGLLKQVVGPLIEKVLGDKTLYLETNPSDIYKLWRNQLEMESGQIQDMPQTVSRESALCFPHVVKVLNKTINDLKNISLEFLNKITESRDWIPYGMLYMAKVLYDSLTEKFPHAPEKDILKAVGNLIYYHFINAAIVAPDTFDIVSLPVDKSLSSNQRRNLATIAKILQFASTKKGFGDESPHLGCLNQFIIECHEQFKSFFRYCCQVEDLEEHFNIHEYTEATLIQKPEICISLQELCDIHNLVLNYQDEIAPDQSDTLHDLLEDLGPAPSVASLLGISQSTYETNFPRYCKTEVCLVLTNKYQIPRHDDANLSNLFIQAKELLVSVLPFLKRQTLVESLETTCSPMYVKLYDHEHSMAMPTLHVIRESSSINDCKLQLRSYLHKLELEGWVNRADGYQTIVTAIAKDICNKKKYRVMRDKELQTLRATKERLEEKTKYYEEQVKFYNQYIQRCLENLHTGKGSRRAYQALQKDTHGKLRSKMTLKYSAWKLQEKGVLVEVDGLTQTELRNVIFEISPTEHSGLFAVNCRFMGLEMEKLDINIQELLQLQYEGASIMNMFGRAKVNVNLLLHLLNRKFYGKT
ncbi:ras GTPase-activating-like protein IQGAP1 isoform X1 [Odontomachus brunneus]|uniref:ras GTPase-activating-like protein IQGAP1 isoform X1 n=1 Tax=Odontomachus brunneus TaxID=486640 RepID=UPI0013F23B93|nr:ras GTPase-activating-like protein IQGAP1 isoform X1 [Odontomachus brunneus]XP_032684179.1 ras GTPase-activating-like protein IQGAP1 isoform X1 [Odontomachus brunneus]